MCNNSPSSFLGIILNHNQAHLLAQQLAHVVLITPNTPPARNDMQRNNKSIFFFCLLPSLMDSQGAAEADGRGGRGGGRKNEGDQVRVGGEGNGGGGREEQN